MTLDGCQDDLKLPSWVPNFIRPTSRRTTPIHGPWFAGGLNKFDSIHEQTLMMLPSFVEIEPGKEVLGLHGVTIVDVIDGVGAIQPFLQKRIGASSSNFAVGVVQPSKPKTKANPLYENEHTVKRCISRTLTCGTDITGHQREFARLLSCFAPEVPEPTHPDFWNSYFLNANLSLVFNGKPLHAWLDLYKERPDLYCSTDEIRKDWAEVSAAMSAMKSKIRGRRLFVTAERGFLGLGPMSTQPGYLLVTAYGCAKPLILVPLGGGRFKILGECYVDDIMEGEAANMDLPDSDVGSILVE